MFTANAFLPDLFFARPMYFREQTCGAYTALPFFVSRLLCQLPWVLLEQLPLAAIIHFLSNLNMANHSAALGWMWACFVITRYASITATYFIGSLFAQPNNANTIHATYFNLLFAFTGFLVRGPQIPAGWKWSAHTTTTHTRTPRVMRAVASPSPLMFVCLSSAACVLLCVVPLPLAVPRFPA